MSTKLYEAAVIGTVTGQEYVSRWNYRSDGDDVPSKNSFGLATAMGFIATSGSFIADTIASTLQASSSPDVIWNQIIVRAIYDPVDFVDIPFVPAATGTQNSGDKTAPFLAFGFRTNRVRADIGRGYKRFAGLTEGVMDAGGAVSSAFLAGMVVLAGLMSDTLSFTESSLTVTFTPVVVKKFRYTAPSGKPAYRYYTTDEGGETVQMENLASGVTWEPYDHVRSQVSRQYGKGR